MRSQLAAFLLLATPASLSAAGLFEGVSTCPTKQSDPALRDELAATAAQTLWPRSSRDRLPTGSAQRCLDRFWTPPLELDFRPRTAELQGSSSLQRATFEPRMELASSFFGDSAERPDGTTAPPAHGVAPATTQKGTRRLPFLGEKAREAGYELPLPFGTGPVYYYLSRDIEVSEVRVGRNGAAPEPVGDFVQLASHAEVNNLNAKFDVWLLPFLNLYAFAGYVWNQADTTIEVSLPPLLPNGEPRRRRIELPTKVEGTVAGLGITLAGGWKQLFVAADVNKALADIGFDEAFEATVSSIRVGWNGELGSRPFRIWLNGTYWDTFAVAAGTVADPDGGTLHFEVGQGPDHPYTYGAGAQYSVRPWLDLAGDVGIDFHGGWYVALVPVFRF